jgi:hypothetical protein
VGEEVAKILAERICLNLPADVKVHLHDWDVFKRRITQVLLSDSSKKLIIASISEEDWIEYGMTH